eukprot:jgi/Chrzof1/8564/Cz03g15240.t1
MFAWGAGTHGQLGNASLADALCPVGVCAVSSSIQAVAGGGNHVVAVIGDGSVVAWGSAHAGTSSYGAAAAAAAADDDDDSAQPWNSNHLVLTPTPVPGLQGITITKVAAGWEHTLFLSGAGHVFVAGDNSFGQLGIGLGVSAVTKSVMSLEGLSGRSVDVACGIRHTLLLQQVSSIQYAASLGSTAVNDGTQAGTALKQQVPAGNFIASSNSSVSDYKSSQQQDDVAACADGDHSNVTNLIPNQQQHRLIVYGFGSNRRMQLGVHQTAPHEEAVPSLAGVSPLTTTQYTETHVRGSTEHGSRTSTSSSTSSSTSRSTLRHHTNQPVNSKCSKGDSSHTSSIVWKPIPVAAAAHLEACKVCAGGDRSGLLTQDGVLYLWGRGVANYPGCSMPTAVAVPQQSAVADALLQQSWQQQQQQQHHPPHKTPQQQQQQQQQQRRPSHPKQAAAMQQDQPVQAGGVRLLANQAAGRERNDIDEPATAGRRQLVSTPYWTSVSMGWGHILGLDNLGRVWAWGSNLHGQLGCYSQTQAQQAQAHHDVQTTSALPPSQCDNSSAEWSTPHPSSVDGACTDASSSATSTMQNGTRASVANNSTSTAAAAAATPVLVELPPQKPAIAVAAGAEHSAAVLCDGSVWCWGWGEHGQLGSGDTANRCLPTQVDFTHQGAGAIAGVTCGSGFTVAWGYGDIQQTAGTAAIQALHLSSSSSST